MWQSTFVVFHLDRCSIPGAMQGAIIPFLTCRESLPPVHVGENTRLISIPISLLQKAELWVFDSLG